MVEKICKILGNFFAYCLEISGHEFLNKVEEKQEVQNDDFSNKDLIKEWLYGGEINGEDEEQE